MVMIRMLQYESLLHRRIYALVVRWQPRWVPKLYMRACGVDINKSWHYKPLGPGRQIRLLRLHRWVPFAGVRGSIIHVDLDANPVPEYQAISYHWGTSREKEPVSVDGAVFEVSQATHDALAGCSFPWRSQLVWIDYLCINQGDYQEKGSQVALMKDIYRAAARVVVCLGETPLAAFVHGLFNELMLETSQPYFEKSTLFSKYEHEGLSTRWLALVEFLNNPWFARVWIVQEVAMASEIRLRFAGWTYDWDALVDALMPLLEAPDMAGFLQMTVRGRTAVGQLINIHQLRQTKVKMIMVTAYQTVKKSQNLMRALAQVFKDELRRKNMEAAMDPKSPTPLALLLDDFHQFKASDPRDRVYALLGLMADDVPPSLAPNYAPDVKAQDVFLAAARHVLRESDHGLFVLAYGDVGTPERKRLPDLPSWVPDWTNLPPVAMLTSYHVGMFPFDYAASGRANKTYYANDDSTPRVLTLQCTRADRIAAVGPCFETISDDQFTRDANGQFFHMSELLATRDWHSRSLAIARSRVPDPYPFQKGQSFEEAFWRTLAGDVYDTTRPAPADLAGAYRQWVDVHDELAALCKDPATASFPTDDAFWRRVHDIGVWGNAMGKCTNGRRVCVTRDGYLGCVPASAEPQDEIFVVTGAKTPFVVREAKESEKRAYRIVGECYIHGMMDGEVLERGVDAAFIDFV